jgi:hypothetical protein
MTPKIRNAKAIVRSTTRQRCRRSHRLRNVFQLAGGLPLVQDAIRLLIGTKAVIEYKIASTHKMADAANQPGKWPD